MRGFLSGFVHVCACMDFGLEFSVFRTSAFGLEILALRTSGRRGEGVERAANTVFFAAAASNRCLRLLQLAATTGLLLSSPHINEK